MKTVWMKYEDFKNMKEYDESCGRILTSKDDSELVDIRSVSAPYNVKQLTTTEKRLNDSGIPYQTEEEHDKIYKMKRNQDKAEWDKNNTTQIKLKLNNNTDADILERLESVESKQTYIKGLIRADIKLEDEVVRSNEYDDVLEYLKDISNKNEEEADAHASNYIDDAYPDMDEARKKKTIEIAVEQFLSW